MQIEVVVNYIKKSQQDYGKREEKDKMIEVSKELVKYENDPALKKLDDIVSETVKKEGIRPYQVFRDEEILLLMKVRPKTIEELEGLRGFPKGGARVTKYGTRIINAFKEAQNTGKIVEKPTSPNLNTVSAF